MVRPFYRNTRLLVLAIALMLFWGLSSFQVLPRQEDPELVSRNAIVTTLLPGASAERVEALVTEVIEAEISEVEEVKTIESDSRAGLSTIQIELQDTVLDAELVWSKVRDELDDAALQLPPEATEPEFEEADVRAYAMILALTWTRQEPANYAILRRYTEDLDVMVRGIAGTEQVDLFGDPDEEITVEVRSADLAAVGLTATQLAQQIQASDAKVTAGQLRDRDTNLPIEIDSELDSVERVRQIPIQSSTAAQFTRLGDIARVERGITQPPADLALVEGKPAIALGVLMESGKRIDVWAATVRQQVDSFRDRLPSGVELTIVFDQSNYVETRLNDLILNLLMGALLVFGVTFLAMGWRSSLVISSALPLTVFVTLGLMRVVNIPIHQMSVTGLIIALGLLIDNAIVMVDEVEIQMRRGLKPEQAATAAVKYLQAPLLASTLTTVLAFTPIALLPGSAGEFVGSIAETVIIALLTSLALSLSLIPAVAALAARRQHHLQPHLQLGWWNTGLTSPHLALLYRQSLDWVLAKPLLGIALAALVPLFGFLQAGNLPEQFFPSVDRDQFRIDFELPAQTAIAETHDRVVDARNLILQHPEVQDVHWFVGESAPKFYYNITDKRENTPNYAQALVQLKSHKGARSLIRTVQEELDRAYPEAQVLVRQLEQGPPYEAPVEMRLYGADIDRLRELGDRARAILASIPDVVHTRDDLSEALPKLGLQVDEEQARLAGLDNAAIARQLAAQLEGAVGGSILEATEELPVRVRLSDAQRGNLSDIASLDVLPEGAVANGNDFRPLSALGEFDLLPELAKISRRNEQRVNTVQGFVTAGVLPATVLAEFQQRLESEGFDLPPGYAYEFGGEEAERDESVGNLMSTVGLLAVLMVASLALSLGSFRLTGIIIIVAIFSIGLSLAALWMFGSILGFMAIIGTMGLVGVAINDSIAVVAALKADPEAARGDRHAIKSVVLHNTRHVITTTVTTIAGFIPLLVSGGAFWQPLAIAIAGGVGGATLLALYFVPSVYLLLKRGGRGNAQPGRERSRGSMSVYGGSV